MSNYHITDEQVQVESFGQLLETGLRDEFRPAIPAVIWLFRAWLESSDLRPDAQPVVPDQNRIKTAELLRRIDASIAWLERGEVLPGASTCIGLNDIKQIRAIVSAAPHRLMPVVPMTPDQIQRAFLAAPTNYVRAFSFGIAAAEAHHGITTPSNQTTSTE